MTDKKPNFSNILAYLRKENAASNLRVVAARAKVSEGELRDIIFGKECITEEMAYRISLVTEPEFDQWTLDPDDPRFLVVPNLTDAQIVENLRFAQSEGVLQVIANVSGVKGGLTALEAICEIGPSARLDPLTRVLLLNIMVEEKDDDDEDV